MAKGSLIGWLNRPGSDPATWNPLLGCKPVSAGCDQCYAPRQVARQEHLPGRDGITERDPLGQRVWTGKVVTMPERLREPASWPKPHMVFVNSLSDLFNAQVTEDFIAQVWQVMADTPRHIYVILTKQPKRMRDIVRRMVERFGVLPNVWLGVSAEDQHNAEVRVFYLLSTPAAIRVVSCEPLLGPIDLTRLHIGGGRYLDALAGDLGNEKGEIYAAAPAALDWVIVGGESGRRTRARAMHPNWARQLRDQAVAARCALFFKQWGSWGPAPWVVRVYDSAQGWHGTDEELAAAKKESERIGATHAYAVWADRYDHNMYEPPHKPWSTDRTSLDETKQAPMRFFPGKSAGDELDGRRWQQWPSIDGLIVDAARQRIGAK